MTEDTFIIYKDKAYRARSVTPSNGERLRKANWKFNNRDGWFTTNTLSAYRVRDLIVDENLKQSMKKLFINYSPCTSALVVPFPLTFKLHQYESTYYALSRNRSYLALAPGLGKTAIAARIAATSKLKTLYICPPFLVNNTIDEFSTWSPELIFAIDFFVVGDSMITKQIFKELIRDVNPELIIIDEAHRFKSEDAHRSKAMFTSIVKRSSVKKLVYMSGTPMPNRPMELYNILSASAGQYINFIGREHYGMKYCNGFDVINPYNGSIMGKDFSGCNEVEFAKLMDRVKSKDAHDPKGFMLSLNKSILGLPKLSEEVVILNGGLPIKFSQTEKDILKQYSPQDLIKTHFAKKLGKADEDLNLMNYRRLLGEYKVRDCLVYIKSILEETEDNILIACIHKDVVQKLHDGLFNYAPYIITGETPTERRQSIVNKYQSDDFGRVIIGNIDAIGVGFTLTKANRVILVEWQWSPGQNRQLIDRVHRMGLKHEVTAQYLCYRNSLDRLILNTLLEKERITAYV